MGRTMEILIEGQAKNQNLAARGGAAAGAGRVWTGRTTCNRVVNFLSDSPREMAGKFALVKIVGATALSLQGELVADAAARAEAG